MAEIAVTGWFISPIIKEMLDKASSYIGSQYNWNKDMAKDLDHLDQTLTEILAMVSTIERRNIRDINQKKLLSRLKDAVYTAEDVLDDFDYLVLRSQSRALNRHGRFNYFSSSCKELCKRLLGADNFRKSLSDILTRLEEVRTSADCLIKLVGLDNVGVLKRTEIPHSRITSSFVRERKTFGREEELNNVVELLLEVDDENGSASMDLDLVSIIGVGGMGKTTLAQLVYNETRICGAFDLRMWVCVSDVFDEIRLTRDILESISNEDYNHIKTLDGLQRILREKLGSMRFLLVLDDVWYDEEMSNWDSKLLWGKVLAPLRNVSRGCKVLITTRMEKVHELMGIKIYIPLEGLAKDAYWLLFEKHAFCRDDPDEYPELKVIGTGIAERLAGSPLAAKVIGRLLNANLDIIHWNKVLESDISDDIMKVLKLSYQHLPEHLQVCFAYCGLFPKDWYIVPNRLVNMWIAQGLVQMPEGSNDFVQSIGNEYFDELVTRSFIERSNWLSGTYVMHDLMNDLARHVSKDEYLRINNDRFREISPTIRHLSIDPSYVEKLSNNKNRLKSLRTLLILRKSWPCWKATLEEDVITTFKRIRVLDLSGCCLDSLPRPIGHMKHLRYIAFKVPEKPLPQSLSRLYHLEVLVIHGHSCRYNEPANIPKSITNLINLRHASILNVGGAIIPMLGSQARLQGHGEFHVKNENGQRLRDLKDMNNLNGKLTIKYLENVSNEQEAEEAYLYRKEGLTRLELEWTNASNMGSNNSLELLRPHANLEQLSVKGYIGKGSPSWLETHYLTKLRFLDLENISWLEQQEMPSLGQLSSLEYLRIKKLNSLKKISSQFYGPRGGIFGFPCLIDLIFDEMPLLEEWDSATQEGQENHLFPNLERFHMSNCPRLLDAPVFQSRPKIEIDITSGWLPTLSLVNSLKSSTEQLFFSASTFSFLDHIETDQLTCIKELEIIDCLEHVPVECRGLISLKKLRLKDCTGIFSFIQGVDMGTILPSTIDYMEIINCVIDTELIPIYCQNLTSLSIIIISVCNQITSLTFGLEPNNLINLQVVNIRECEGLISLDGFESLINLKKLMVLDCNSFCSLPNDLDRVRSLKVLVVCGCPEIKYLPENGLPNSLEMVLLSRCHQDLQKQLQEKHGLEWEKIKNIPEIIVKVELIHLMTLFEDCSA